MIKIYRLKIDVPELKINYSDICEAENKQEAARAFFINLPPEMSEWKDVFILENYILTKEEKEFEDSLVLLENPTQWHL